MRHTERSRERDKLMQVEIWSDYMCPFCYIGKRHFEAALADFPHRDEVEIVWRSFELNPHEAVETSGDAHDYLAAKYGMSRDQAVAAHQQMTERAAAVGLRYNLDAVHRTNSFDAHRLTHFAARNGKAEALTERLLAAHFTEGQHLGRHETLKQLAAEIGLDAAEVETMLASDAYAAEVRADERLGQEFGISGVPFFVIDRRYGVSGAQPPELFAEALGQAWQDRQSSAELVGATIS